MSQRESTRPTIICLTPVKNEEWILDTFLRCASLWADRIIIADQGSTDDSRTIASRHEKVALIANPSTKFNEPERQALLIEEARKVPGPRILLALDADEMLTANFRTSEEWHALSDAAKGTVLNFDWINVRPGFANYWSPANKFPRGFIDDGSRHEGLKIHSPRVPVPENAPALDMDEVKVVHYQYVDWARMESKQRWYQCWEVLNHEIPSFLRLYRTYHHMNTVRCSDIRPIDNAWFSYYQEHGINVFDIPTGGPYWWDNEVLEMLTTHGPARFARLAIWDVDWQAIARKHNIRCDTSLADPRGGIWRSMHRYLRATQPVAGNPVVRLIDRYLAGLGL